jgi:hypothetical protein
MTASAGVNCRKRSNWSSVAVLSVMPRCFNEAHEIANGYYFVDEIVRKLDVIVISITIISLGDQGSQLRHH